MKKILFTERNKKMKTYSHLLTYADCYHEASEKRLQAKKEYRAAVRKENRTFARDMMLFGAGACTLYLIYVILHGMYYYG